MRLLRVQVPEFRVLKDVDISFEPEFTPQVFPLGSLNGGGKSTLLQLIFVLLSCFWSNNKISYLKNFLFEFQLDSPNEIKKIASITILNNENEEINLTYFCGNKDIFENYKKTLDKKKYYPFVIDRFMVVVGVNNDSKEPSFIKKCYEYNNVKLDVNVFLISPSNQSYLFLPREDRRLLFTSYNNKKTHEEVLKKLKDILPNFFTYDFIDNLTEICRLARDKDFDEKLKTGVYGTHYEQLEEKIKNLFIDGKKIIPLTIEQVRHTKDAIQSMGFKLPSGKEIYPEDLSHGELKRLVIFVLLKRPEIQNSIVLMDEIESAFHPRWQRYIVDDLVEWGENNQYILATHSYEVCRNVTFDHIKELPPKLFPENQE